MAGREGLDLQPLGHDWLDDLLMIDEVEQEEARNRRDGLDDDDFEDFDP